MGSTDGDNGHGPQRPPADVRLYQRRRAATQAPGTTVGTTTASTESESGAMGTQGEDVLASWLIRLEGKLDDVIQNVLPRVAALETNVATLLAAPARFRAWTSWATGMVVAAMGCFGCVGTLGSLAGVASFILVLVTRLR